MARWVAGMSITSGGTPVDAGVGAESIVASARAAESDVGARVSTGAGVAARRPCRRWLHSYSVGGQRSRMDGTGGCSMGWSSTSGRRHIVREQLECDIRLRSHICSIVSICVAVVKLVGLHAMPRRIARCLHGKEQRSGCIAVGLGKRQKCWPGVAKAPRCSLRVARAMCHKSHSAVGKLPLSLRDRLLVAWG